MTRAQIFEEGQGEMTANEWRNHTDERIAALFAALDDLTVKQNDNAKQIADLTRTVNVMFAETNRRINENWDKTQEAINMLLASQIKAEQRMDHIDKRMDAADKRMDRLEENIDRVINKVDSWLDSLQSRNGKS